MAVFLLKVIINKKIWNFIFMAKKKILVIDDDSTIRDLLKKLLELNDYTVDTADNGQLGFEKAVTEDYDLVTMDIKMPQWNGLEAIGGLEIVKPDLKILVISGFLSEFENQKIDSAPNVLKLLAKPFNIKDAIAEIDKILNK